MYKRIAISILVSLIGLTLLLTPLQAKRSGIFTTRTKWPFLCIIMCMKRTPAPAQLQAHYFKISFNRYLAKAIISFH